MPRLWLQKLDRVAREAAQGGFQAPVSRSSPTRATGLDAERATDIGWSAMLHDVGKLHVPDRILLKPGPLSPDDGSGYPDGLRGERIPLEARIVRIADAFDAMTHPRPYQPARAIEWALEELARYAGTQFDPELARLFIDQVRNDAGLRERLLAHRAAHGSLELRTA